MTTAPPELDWLPEAIFVLESGRVVRANAAAHRLLGVPAGALLGRALPRLLAPTERSRASELAALEQPRVFRTRLLDAEGVEVPVQARVSPLGPGRLVLSVRDASGLVRAEGLLAELGRLPHAVRDDPLALVDAAIPLMAGLGWGLLLLALEPEGVRVVRRVAPPAPDHQAWMERAVPEGIVVPLEQAVAFQHMLRHQAPVLVDDLRDLGEAPGGPVRDLEAQASPLGAAVTPIRRGGEIGGALMTLGVRLTEWDLMALELFAGQVAAAEHLASLRSRAVQRERLAAVGEVAADLGRQLARRVAGLRALTGDALGMNADPLSARLLAMAEEEIDRLARLAQELGALTRPVEARPEPMVARDVVQEAVAVAARGRGVAPVAPQLRFPPGLPRVWVDRRLAVEALSRILENALQHVPPTGRVEVEGFQQGDRLSLDISNDGPPVPEAARDRLFEPFFTTQATGTGLGLAAARRFLEELGGRVLLHQSEAPVVLRVELPIHGGGDAG